MRKFQQLSFVLLVVSGPRTANRAETLLVLMPRVERDEVTEAASARQLVIEVDSRARVIQLANATIFPLRDELDRRIASAMGGSVLQESSVETRAEAAAPHGAVLDLLQHLRLLGFADVRLTAVADPRATSLFGGEPLRIDGPSSVALSCCRTRTHREHGEKHAFSRPDP